MTFYEAQDEGIPRAAQTGNAKLIAMQPAITEAESQWAGPFPFSSDGTVVGRSTEVGFEEEMQTMISFAGGEVDLPTLWHENFHQWWGDNVSEANYNLTFFKEGLATLGEFFFAARNAQTAAGGAGTQAGDAAFEQSLVDSFNGIYGNTAFNWTGAPSDPSPHSLFSGSSTYDRPGIAYIALRRILGPASFAAALQQIQRTYRQGNITEPQLEAGFKAFLPVQTSACNAKLGQFFTQWFDTAYAAGGGANRPQITGPGLAGGGFQCG
jgi:hypothetical protein